MAHQANGRNYQFYGKGRKKSGRRANGARPRKMYPYVTKKQHGTPIERMVHANYDELQHQYNDKNLGPGTMEQGDATGKLGARWGNIKRRMTTGSAISRHINDHGGTVTQAHSHLVGLTGVRFGGDPMSK